MSSWLRSNQTLEPGGIAIIGFPTHVGVVRNGGRPGAAHGPAAIRAAFSRLTPDAMDPSAFSSVLDKSLDLGNIRSAGGSPGASSGLADEDPLLQSQRALGVVVRRVLRAGGVPVILGGGHETAFGHYLGLQEVFDDVTLLNWDAHADVRSTNRGLGHSGSPFRQAIEFDPSKKPRYVVGGLSRHSVASEHLEFVRAHGQAFFRDEIDADCVRDVYASLASPTQMSFDMDAVRAADAPGVSAPSIGGFSTEEWLEIAYAGGRNRNVKSVDVVEVNPAFDIDGRTARLAALTLWHFIRGLARREVHD